MDTKIRPKQNLNIVYGDVQQAEEVTNTVGLSEEKIKEVLERSEAEIKDLITECSPEDQKPIMD